MNDELKANLIDKTIKTARTFVQGYGGAWIGYGADFDTLFTVNNAKAGVVAAAIYLMMLAGVTGFKRNK